MSAAEGLAVQDVAREAGVAPSTVRLYARRGVLHFRRTPGNARRFGPDAPCRIAIAKAAQRAGLTLTEITGLLRDLPDEVTQQDWDRLNEAIVAAAERRIRALRELVDDITVREPLSESAVCPAGAGERARRAG